MQTFIEQKDDIKRRIEYLERRDQRLQEEIDFNEEEIAQLQRTIAIVGTAFEPSSIMELTK